MLHAASSWLFLFKDALVHFKTVIICDVNSIYVDGDVATGGNLSNETCVQLEFSFRPVSKTVAQFYFSLRHACM